MYYSASIGPVDVGCVHCDQADYFLACVEATGDGYVKNFATLEEGKSFVASFFHDEIKPHIIWTEVPQLPLGARAETVRR